MKSVSLFRTSAIAIGVVLLLGVLGYYGMLFYSLDFNPDFLKIERCQNSGMSWNYEKQECPPIEPVL